jgi:YD repeat-containing protein
MIIIVLTINFLIIQTYLERTVMNTKHINFFGCVILLCFLLTFSALSTTAQYAYDNLNRLVMVQYDDGTTIQYTYDAVGNRLTQEVTAFSQMLSLPSGEPSPTGQGGAIPADAPTLQNFRASSRG